MTTKRKNHSAQFKAKVALAAVKGDKTISEVAAKFEIHPNQIGKWKKQLLQELPSVFSQNADVDKAADEQLKARLYQQIGQLQVELDWLKKNCGLDA